MATTLPMDTILLLVRHGDRWDYANAAAWEAAAESQGFEAADPPLSALGHEQARCAAGALAGEGVQAILASPYLRAIQTAQPLAHLCGLPILLEEGLAELCHEPGATPKRAGARFPFFPEVDLTYQSLCSIEPTGTDPSSGRPRESTLEYLRRMIFLAKLLPQRFPGRCVACFSHAASLALVAALTGSTLFETGKFAPCGIFKLVSRDGSSWVVERHGCDNSPYVKRNNPTTFPWGFADLSREPAEELWHKARKAQAEAEVAA